MRAIVVTNPDMLHTGLCRTTRRGAAFFAG
jgi:ATP-dependent helicase YprA (DUF1998 family)